MHINGGANRRRRRRLSWKELRADTVGYIVQSRYIKWKSNRIVMRCVFLIRLLGENDDGSSSVRVQFRFFPSLCIV